MNLADDPRWLRLNGREWQCAACGQTHCGLFDMACSKPEPYPGEEPQRLNSELTMTGNILTEDFCVLEGQHFFVRCVLELPILGSSTGRFGYGVWATLSRANFDIYIANFNQGLPEGLGPWFGWFSNRLNGYPDTLNLKTNLHIQSGRRRPLVELEPSGHPLAIEQAKGISLDRVLDIYALNGHDIRPPLEIAAPG